MKSSTATRLPHHGNDFYRKISAPGKRRKLPVTYWDVWFLVVLLADFAGDWEKLADRLRQERQGASLFSRRDAAEELLSHLLALRHTLTQAALTPETVLGADGPTLLRSERRRAQQAILEKTPCDDEKSEWMQRMPRRRLTDRAMRGYWPRFPVSPEPYAGALAGLYKRSGWYSED